jgi:hypothetical protein
MIEAGIHALITSDPTLNGLIADRLYPVRIPSGVTYPCASYQVVSASPESVSLDSAATRMKRIQFDCWATTYGECKQIEAALASLLDGYQGTLSDGTKVLLATPGVVIDRWEEDATVYRVMTEYIFDFTF